MKLHQRFGKRLKIVVLGASFLGANIILGPLSAKEPTSRDTIFFTTPPSPSEITNHIFPKKRVLTRSIFNEVTIEEVTDSKPVKSIGMPVLFHFGKTTLVESSKPFLDIVGIALLDPDHKDEIVIIEGHTDAVGTNHNNFKLSERRALAVKEYLVNEYSIEPLRLFTEGKGERQLFDKANPNAGVNRRVEFLRYPL